MFLLDPKAAGARPRRRLRDGARGSGESGGLVCDVSVAIALSAGEDGISFLCRTVLRLAVRARWTRALRQVPRSTWRTRAAPKGLGGELSAELRGSRRPDRCRDCPHRRTLARCRATV